MASYVLPSSGEGGNTAGDIHWKAPVADYASLPASGNSNGDTRVALDTSDQWTWNGSAWVSPTAGAIALTNSQIFVGNASNVATSVAMSGDATIANTGAVTIANSAITNAKVSASAAIAFSKMEALASARLIVGSAGNVPTAVDVTGDVTISNTGVTTIGASKVTEAMQVLADNTTNDVSTTKHGYAPKAPNDATKYLDGTGAWSVPAGGGGGLSAPLTGTSGGNTNLTVFPTQAAITSVSIPAPAGTSDTYLVWWNIPDIFDGVIASATDPARSLYSLDDGSLIMASGRLGHNLLAGASATELTEATHSGVYVYTATGAVTLTLQGCVRYALDGSSATWIAGQGAYLVAQKIFSTP